MNTFTQGVPTTTSECPRPWFMQGALQAVSLHRADSFQGDHSLHLQQQQPLHQTQQHVNAVPSHTQSSHMTIPQTLNSHDAHLRVPSRPPSIHNQGRIPSPAQVGLPRAMGHTVQSHPYHEQSPMSGNHINHTQQEAPRVPSRSQPDQRIPSPVQHGLPSMPSHSLHDQPRVPSRSHLDQGRIPSPAQHDIADMASHSHHPQARMPHSHIEASNHHSDQSRVHSQSPHDHHPSVSSHVTHHEQSRLVSHTPHDQSQMPSHSQHDQSQMPSHSQHDQSQIPSHDHSQMPSHDQSQIQSHSQHEQVQMPARTQQEQAHLPNHSQHDQSQLQGQGQHKPAQMPSHTSHEQSRMASHSSHEQPRMPSHSQHEQTQQMQMPARTQHDQSQHEQPRAPSRSQHDTQRQISGHADGNAHGNQTAALDLLHSQAEHGGFDLHGMSETFRQMAKQHGALGPAAPSEYFPLTVPLAGMGQSLATQFHKPTMARNPYFNNPAYKPTETGMMKCNFCTDVFANALQLQTHMIAHYEMAIRSLPGNPFGDLRQTVKTEKDLLAGADLSLKQSAGHIGAGNNEVAMDTSSTGTPNTSLTETTKTPKPIAEKKHECATCAKRFTRTDHLRRHVMKIHPEVMQQASASGMVTPQLNQIRNDPPTITAKKTDGPHQCFICGKRFKRSDHLKRHMTKAHPDLLPTEATRSLFMKFDIHAMYGDAGPPLKSPKPKSPFVPNYTEAEKQEKRHVCITCEKRFKRQDHLKRHITIHSDEKPFDCVLCGKGFRREHHVKRHERTHTGEKPYECVTCGKKFARIDHMKKHNKSHLFDGIRKPGQKLNQSLSAMDVSVPVSVPVSEPLTFFDDIRKPLQKLNPVLPSVTMATSESLAMCAPLPTTCMAGGI